MILYHYCCAHSADDIVQSRILKPSWVTWKRLDSELRKHGLPPTGLAGSPMVLWLTDLAEFGDPNVLGLAQRPGLCNRTEFRFTVDTDIATPWPTWAMLRLANPAWRSTLESYGKPEHWYVTTEAVPYLSMDDLRKQPQEEQQL